MEFKIGNPTTQPKAPKATFCLKINQDNFPSLELKETSHYFKLEDIDELKIAIKFIEWVAGNDYPTLNEINQRVALKEAELDINLYAIIGRDAEIVDDESNATRPYFKELTYFDADKIERAVRIDK